MKEEIESLIGALNNRFTAHPWHGISIGDKSPEIVNAFIEIIPEDAIKYEVDKDSGYIMVDRPQKFSNHMPCMYGFVPQTYCDTKVAEFCAEKTGREDIVGDHDPLDICVLSERNVSRGGILAEAKVIGGFRMIDGGEADDKIIAVLKGDQAYGEMSDISQMPKMVIDRVKHFFLTYKDLEGTSKNVEITHVYGKDEALEVIKRSNEDYVSKFGDANEQLKAALERFFTVKA
ncbi:inorganic pyrophosphatase [Wandonia haliotis]|uniref:Inorganic pyrophosphatase n=1 Tax=Wandonia haliotis TaxID=574963 RepID=A0ABP3YAW4_9FLAO